MVVSLVIACAATACHFGYDYKYGDTTYTMTSEQADYHKKVIRPILARRDQMRANGASDVEVFEYLCGALDEPIRAAPDEWADNFTSARKLLESDKAYACQAAKDAQDDEAARSATRHDSITRPGVQIISDADLPKASFVSIDALLSEGGDGRERFLRRAKEAGYVSVFDGGLTDAVNGLASGRYKLAEFEGAVLTRAKLDDLFKVLQVLVDGETLFTSDVADLPVMIKGGFVRGYLPMDVEGYAVKGVVKYQGLVGPQQAIVLAPALYFENRD